MSSTRRWYGGSGRTVTPKLRAMFLSPSASRSPRSRLSHRARGLPDCEERGRPAEADREEGQPAVAWKAEREACERRADEDHEDSRPVHESDGCCWGIRARAERHVEDRSERESGCKADGQRGERGDP